MADANVTLKPVVAIDSTTNFVATREINGQREVVQVDADDLRGLDGISAIATITNTTPSAIPAAGQNVTYNVGSSAGFVVDQIVAVGSASTLKVIGTPTATSIVLENIDATPGAVTTGAKIIPAGRRGASGTNGTNGTNGAAGINAIASTTGTNPNTPAVGSTATYNMDSTAGLLTQQYYGFQGVTGTFLITAIPSATTVTIRNIDATPGTTVAAGTKFGPVGKAASSASGGASGVPYVYDNQAPPTAQGQIRTPQTSLAVATVLAIDLEDSNTDSAVDITARLKTGTIFTVSKNAANYVRFEATADYSSSAGTVAVTVSAEQGTIADGDAVFLAIASDAPSSSSSGSTSSSSGSISWQITTTSTISSVADTGYIADSTGAQRFTLPTAIVGKPFEVQSISTGTKEIVGAQILMPSGSQGLGLRNLSSASHASVGLLCVSNAPARWAVNKSSDISHWELFDPTGYDTDAIAVFTAIEAVLTANSLATTLLSSIIKSALNSRILAKKTNGTWSSTVFYYGFLGGAITSNTVAAEAIDSINFRTPGTFNISAWTGGTFTRSVLGTAANGTNQLANTQVLIDTTNFPSAGHVMGCYNTSVITESDAYLIGGGVNDHVIYARAGELRFSSYGGSAGTLSTPTGNLSRAKGIKAGIRINATQIKIAAGSTISSEISSAATSATNYGNLFLFARSDGNFGSAASFGSFWANNTAWTDSQISQENTDEIAYQTALSRQ